MEVKMNNEDKHTVEKETAMVYKIRLNKSCGGWADITIREWPKGGSIDCQSDYGNYSYSWGSIGDCTLREFLCRLDFHYFMGKTRGGYGQIFSIEKTLAELKAEIIQQRKNNDLNKDDAHDCWEQVKRIDEFTGDNLCEYTRAIEINDSFVKKLYGGDYTCVPFCKIDDPECAAFWERIWPIACEVWEEEING